MKWLFAETLVRMLGPMVAGRRKFTGGAVLMSRSSIELMVAYLPPMTVVETDAATSHRLKARAIKEQP